MMENPPTPESRVEAYLAKAAGMDVTPPEPKSRLELYLAKIAGMDVEVPEPTTREEHWLAQIVGIEPSEPLAIEGAVYIDNQKVDVRYLAVAAGVTGASLPEEPQNRKEMYWAAIASGGPTPPPTPTVKALKFTSPEAQTIGRNGSTPSASLINLEYSNDGQSWSSWNIDNPLNFGNGVDVYIRGINATLAPDNNHLRFTFSTASPVYCSGNIMHLFDHTQDLTVMPTGGVAYMFSACAQLVTPPDLPATTLCPLAYRSMFQSCQALVKSPNLPAISVPESAYQSMFYGCKALTEVGELSALEINNYGCDTMFAACTSLAMAPAIPATTIGIQGCAYMFQSCTNLETIPALPATTLNTVCYTYMFDGCKKIKMATAQDSEYTNLFEFGTNPYGKCRRMFRNTGGTFTGDPDQTTYYTANTIIS
jgi:hypothetical protein